MVRYTPRYGCDALPSVRISFTIFLTVLDGTAKPTPTLPVELVPDSIWLVMPITLPLAFSSGPPLLPWLMAASVWIAPEIGRPLGDVMVRLSALTMPDVTVLVRPNGSPIATTPSPTWTAAEFANCSGCSELAAASMWITATSVVGSLPTSFAV